MSRLLPVKATQTSGPRGRSFPLGRRTTLALLLVLLAGSGLLAGALWAGSQAVRTPLRAQRTPTAGPSALVVARAPQNAKPAGGGGPLGGEGPPVLPSALPTTVSPALATVLADLPATLPPQPTPSALVGDAPLPVPPAAVPGSDLVLGPPSLSVTMIDTVLECYNSPT